MEWTELNLNDFLKQVDLNDFLKQLDLADKNHLFFASFVNDAEVFCKNEQDGHADEKLTRYRKIWWDLEIMNALALDDWDSAGRPKYWLPQWEAKYKNDAREVLSELRALLATL